MTPVGRGQRDSSSATADAQDCHRHRHHYQSEGRERHLRVRGVWADGIEDRRGRREAFANSAPWINTIVVVAWRPTRPPCSTSPRTPAPPWPSLHVRGRPRHALRYDDLSKQAGGVRHCRCWCGVLPAARRIPGDRLLLPQPLASNVPPSFAETVHLRPRRVGKPTRLGRERQTEPTRKRNPTARNVGKVLTCGRGGSLGGLEKRRNTISALPRPQVAKVPARAVRSPRCRSSRRSKAKSRHTSRPT